jgi:hypothetical protein
MLRTPLAKAHIKRTIRPLYGWTQATPNSTFLDPAWDRSVDIYPGMCMMRGTAQDTVTLLDGTGMPFGLSALYIGGDGIDEVLEQGVNAMACWVLGPDAEFEVLAPAFDDSLTWTWPTNGTELLVHASTASTNRGKLVPAGASNASAKPVARCVKINSATKITIGGLSLPAAY